MIDFQRYRGLAATTAGMLLVIAAMNFGLLGIFGSVPSWLVPEQNPVPWDYLMEADGRVVGVLREQLHNGQETPFIAILGQSSVMRGLDSDYLQKHDPARRKYLFVYGTGGSMDEMDQISRSLLRGPLHPQVVVLGVHPAFLIGCPQNRELDEALPLRDLATTDPRKIYEVVKSWFWLRRNSGWINKRIQQIVYNWRYAIMADQGAFAALNLNPGNPWAPVNMRHFTLRDRESPEFLETQFRRFCDYGWLDLQAYERSSAGRLDSLRSMVEGALERGSAVLVVAMPEPPSFANLVPPQGMRILENLTAEYRDRQAANPGEPPVRFLDLRAALSEEVFMDHIHLNERGKRLFSEQLFKVLADWPVKVQQQLTLPTEN